MTRARLIGRLMVVIDTLAIWVYLFGSVYCSAHGWPIAAVIWFATIYFPAKWMHEDLTWERRLAEVESDAQKAWARYMTELGFKRVK